MRMLAIAAGLMMQEFHPVFIIYPYGISLYGSPGVLREYSDQRGYGCLAKSGARRGSFKRGFRNRGKKNDSGYLARQNSRRFPKSRKAPHKTW